MNEFASFQIIGLVLARGGSVSIPRKNLSQLGNETLLERCLNTMIQSKCFSSVWVSTDDDEMGSVARKSGAAVHRRAPYTATHEASSVVAVREFLQHCKECNNSSSILCLVQCTSPFLTAKYLQEGLRLITTGERDSVFAAVRSHALRWTLQSNGCVTPVNLLPSSRPSRQQWCGELCETGMFYMTRTTSVAQHGLLQEGRVGVVEVSSDDALDIDTPLDLLLAEAIVHAKSKVEQHKQKRPHHGTEQNLDGEKKDCNFVTDKFENGKHDVEQCTISCHCERLGTIKLA